MVYLAESKRGSKTYFYLVQDVRFSRSNRKQFRKYIGAEKPSKIKLELLVSGFKKEMEEQKQRLFGFHYLLPDEISKTDKINSDFKARFEKLNPAEKNQFEQNFVNVFVYNSNSIEGSTLTPKEVRLLLQENISPNKPLEDVLEAKGAEKTLIYIKTTKEKLSQELLKKLHELYFKDTKPFIAGTFKTRGNLVRGAGFRTTPVRFVFTDMKLFFEEYGKLSKNLHALELAAWAHWKFEKVHPFQDGNGRIGRLIMNFVLWQSGYPMIDIKTKEKQKYFNALEKCDKENTAEPLARLLVKRFEKQYKNSLVQRKH